MAGQAGFLRAAAACAAVAAVAALGFSLPGGAQNQETEAGLKAYIAIPIGGPKEKTSSRVGVQVLTSLDRQDGPAFSAFTPSALETAADLAVSRRGLAKFEVMGADARGAWNTVGQWLGLEVNVPEECETTYRCTPATLLLSGEAAAADEAAR